MNLVIELVDEAKIEEGRKDKYLSWFRRANLRLGWAKKEKHGNLKEKKK